MRAAPARRGERGSATVETAIVVPITLMLIALIIMAGRIALAQQAINAVAFDTARAASLARDTASARSLANTAADYALTSNGLVCASRTLDLNTAGLTAAVGAVGTVSATVNCTVALSDVAFPGMPSSITFTASATSPVDPYRER